MNTIKLNKNGYKNKNTAQSAVYRYIKKNELKNVQRQYTEIEGKIHAEIIIVEITGPQELTQEEKELHNEKEVLEGLILTLLERNGDYATVYEFKDSCQFAKKLYDENEKYEGSNITPEEIKTIDKTTQENIQITAARNAKLIEIAEREEGRTLSEAERATLIFTNDDVTLEDLKKLTQLEEEKEQTKPKNSLEIYENGAKYVALNRKALDF